MTQIQEQAVYNIIAKCPAVMSNEEWRVRHSSRPVLGAMLALACPLETCATHYMEDDIEASEMRALKGRHLFLFRYLSNVSAVPDPRIKPLPYPMRELALIEFVWGWLVHSYGLITKPLDEGDDVWYKNAFLIRNGRAADLRAVCVIETSFIEIHK